MTYLGPALRHNPVQTKELDEQGVWVLLDMGGVLGQELQQQLHLILQPIGMSAVSLLPARASSAHCMSTSL